MIKTKAEKNKDCHSRGMLSGIYNACRCKIGKDALLNGYVEDPRQKPSGMGIKVKKWCFLICFCNKYTISNRPPYALYLIPCVSYIAALIH